MIRWPLRRAQPVPTSACRQGSLPRSRAPPPPPLAPCPHPPSHSCSQGPAPPAAASAHAPAGGGGCGVARDHPSLGLHHAAWPRERDVAAGRNLRAQEASHAGILERANMEGKGGGARGGRRREGRGAVGGGSSPLMTRCCKIQRQRHRAAMCCRVGQKRSSAWGTYVLHTCYNVHYTTTKMANPADVCSGCLAAGGGAGGPRDP